MRRFISIFCLFLLVFGALPVSAENSSADRNITSITAGRELKILAVGNSFSRNSTEYFDDFCNANDIEMTIGVLHIDACTIDMHYKYFCGSGILDTAYEYTKTGQEMRLASGIEVLVEEQWDYVVLQQASEYVGIESSYSRLPELSETIAEYCPSATQILNQTWAMEQDCTVSWFKNRYDSDQQKMYEMLKSCYETAAQTVSDLLQYDVRILPVAEAFQEARTTDGFRYEKGEQSLNSSDGRHANVYGKYLAAAIWYQAFTGYEVTQNTFKPTSVTDKQATVLKRIAYEVAGQYFTLTKREISKCNINTVGDKEYTGEAIEPVMTLKNGTDILKEGKDYTIAYGENTNIGVGTISIRGLDTYTGGLDLTFNIVGKSLENCEITPIPEQVYSGTAIAPAITIFANGKYLQENIDYTVSYKDNDKIGTATATVTGIGTFTGTLEMPFVLRAQSIEYSNITMKSDAEYKGKPIKQAVEVFDGVSTLLNGVDYQLTYKKNNAIGTASVTITGIGNYTGKVTKTFTIKPRQIKIKSAKSGSKGKLRVKWKKWNVSGYIVRYSTNKNFKKYKTVKVKGKANNKLILKGLKSKKRYYVKVCAYKTVKKITYKGEFSARKSVRVA